MPVRTYVPDIASLDECFPAALPVPALLRDFAAWLTTQPRSSLGYFHVEGAALDAKYTGSDAAAEVLRERFGIFLVCADGARLALWQLPDRASAVVQLGRERRVKNVAPDLESYLLQLAQDHAGLRDWLAARGIDGARQPAPEPESFQAWFEATLAAARRTAAASPQPAAAELPADFLQRVDALLGRLVDDPELLAFFASLGLELRAVPGPAQLRQLPLPGSPVTFEIAWPWDLPSEWLEADFPKATRRALEQRRARMLWAVQVSYPSPSPAVLPPLPLGLDPNDDLATIETKLGPPLLGKTGQRTWDFPQRRRSLTARINEGPLADPERPFGSVLSLRWAYGQTV
ncbi:MAG TPA: hypothetical protein VJR89_15300 [Polyangiales bacterium]|nr:hypothetical protein [Polyangiales bacterium]